MIKTLAGHVRFSLYEVKGSYHVNKQATLTRTLIIYWPSSLSLVLNFLNAS
jgi:hypothetical protein